MLPLYRCREKCKSARHGRHKRQYWHTHSYDLYWSRYQGLAPPRQLSAYKSSIQFTRPGHCPGGPVLRL